MSNPARSLWNRGARNLEDKDDPWRLRVTVPSHSVVQFARHLGVLLQASVPLTDSLECLKKQDESLNFGVVIDDMIQRVASGHNLSTSVQAYPKVFPALFSSMLKVGEETGNLVGSLNQLADWLERDQDIQRRLKAALTYPCIVLIVSFVIVVGLFHFVIPQFLGIFESMGKDLPLLTKAVMACSKLVNNPGAWFLFITISLAAWHLLSELWATPAGRLRITLFLVHIPLIGTIMQKSALARFCAAGQMSLQAGTDLLASMKLAGSASQNALIMRDTEHMVRSISEGVSLSEHMSENPDLYGRMLVQTVQTGEESATLDESFGHSALMLEDETRHLLDGLGSALEPVLLMGVGILVGILLLSIFLPLYSMVGNL